LKSAYIDNKPRHKQYLKGQGSSTWA